MAMFGNKEAKKQMENLTQMSTIIGKGTVIHGDIDSSGNIRVEGRVLGNVKAKSKVVVGDSGVIEGNVLAQNAEIAGAVRGILEVAELVAVKATGSIHGDIVTQKLTVDEGATLNGSTKMGAVTKDINLADNKESFAKAI
jgi:cytoskeletal protein CcmA (bactofilin family)